MHLYEPKCSFKVPGVREVACRSGGAAMGLLSGRMLIGTELGEQHYLQKIYTETRSEIQNSVGFPVRKAAVLDFFVDTFS